MPFGPNTGLLLKKCGVTGVRLSQGNTAQLPFFLFTNIYSNTLVHSSPHLPVTYILKKFGTFHTKTTENVFDMESTIIYVCFYERKIPKTFANYFYHFEVYNPTGVTPYYGIRIGRIRIRNDLFRILIRIQIRQKVPDPADRIRIHITAFLTPFLITMILKMRNKIFLRANYRYIMGYFFQGRHVNTVTIQFCV